MVMGGSTFTGIGRWRQTSRDLRTKIKKSFKSQNPQDADEIDFIKPISMVRFFYIFHLILFGLFYSFLVAFYYYFIILAPQLILQILFQRLKPEDQETDPAVMAWRMKQIEDITKKEHKNEIIKHGDYTRTCVRHF